MGKEWLGVDTGSVLGLLLLEREVGLDEYLGTTAWKRDARSAYAIGMFLVLGGDQLTPWSTTRDRGWIPPERTRSGKSWAGSGVALSTWTRHVSSHFPVRTIADSRPCSSGAEYPCPTAILYDT